MDKPQDKDIYTFSKRGASIASRDERFELFFFVIPFIRVILLACLEKGENVDHFYITGFKYRDSDSRNHYVDFLFWVRIL